MFDFVVVLDDHLQFLEICARNFGDLEVSWMEIVGIILTFGRVVAIEGFSVNDDTSAYLG